MRILLLTDRMEAGGAETHIELLAQGLARKGAEVSLLSSGGRMADRLERVGITQYRIPPTDGSLFRFLRAMKEVTGLLRAERFDLLHAHTRRTALFLRNGRHPPPIAVTAHAHYQPLPFPLSRGDWGDATVAVSEDLRAHLCDRFSVPAERITVIPNGIDCNRFSPPKSEPPPHSVVFASRMDDDCTRGGELLCAVLPRLCVAFPDLRITLAGGGNALDRLRRRAEICNRTVGFEAIRVIGHVSEMPSLYQGHSIAVGVSRAAMEAAACGCAVILCGNEGYAGVLSKKVPTPALSNFCCRGFPLPTEEALCRDLISLLENQTYRRESALSAHEWICSEFSATRMIEETVAFYNRLLRLKGASGKGDRV